MCLLARLSEWDWTAEVAESGGDTRDFGPLSSRHVEARMRGVTWRYCSCEFSRVFLFFFIFLPKLVKFITFAYELRF